MRVNVSLPAAWEQVPAEPRAYRRRGVKRGVLRLSLSPPLTGVDDGDAVAAALLNFLQGVELDIGQEVKLFHGPTPMGITATCLRKSPSRGLLQFWLVAGEVTVFASYTMGDLAEAKRDLADAHQIVTGLQLIQVDSGD